MDCLVLPIQGKLEEWKRATLALDKEHSKGVMGHQSQAVHSILTLEAPPVL